MTYYATKDERDAEAQKAIEAYLDTSGDGWTEEVEFVAAGELTHFAQVSHEQMRPADEDLDENGLDSDGTPWEEGVEWRGNYTLEPLPHLQAVAEALVSTNFEVARERERWAKVCEEIGLQAHGAGREDSEAYDCADAIRRG